MIHLHQELVGIVSLLRRRDEVSGLRDQIRLREEVKDLGAHRVHFHRYRVAVLVHKVACTLLERGHISDASYTRASPETFVVEEEKRAVGNDGTAQRAPKLVQAQRRLVEWFDVEVIAGIKRVIAKELINR